jgi:hypothetical protein
MNIDINQLDNLSCDCSPESNLFIEVKALKVLPSLLSPDGKTGFLEHSVARICVKCNKLWTVKQILEFVGNKEKSEKAKIIVATK